MPEAIFDQSSMLPPMNTAGYGGGFDGTPDARINQGSSLFSDMEPYAYGKGDRLSTQTAYLANPHNIQKIVPQLRLPDCNMSTEHCNFTLPHSVTDGDVAFSIRFASGGVRTELMNNPTAYFKQGAGRAVDYICNISTINYIMRGLFTDELYLNPAWKHFAAALGFEDEYKIIQESYKTLRKMQVGKFADIAAKKRLLRKSFRARAEHLVRDHFRPIGVVIGSEKQGGQHEVGQKTVTWPVAYIVNISIDGRNENLCNYWRHLDVSSGSDLGFFVQMKNKDTYALNYTKQVTQKHFTNNLKGDQGDVSHIMNEYPQLCPGTSNTLDGEDDKMSGHWHFCMSQAMHHKATVKQMFNDVTTLHVGALMLSTISVVWVRKRLIDTTFIHNGISKHDNETIFKDCLQFTNNMSTSKATMKHATYPSHTPQYIKSGTSGIARIGITLSTHSEATTRPGVRPRPLTDDEMKEIGAPPRLKARHADSVAKIEVPVALAAKNTNTADFVQVKTLSKSGKKKSSEGGSIL